MAISLSLVLGLDGDLYKSFIDSLPPGEEDLKLGIVVPSHTAEQSPTFEISGLVPEEQYYFYIVGESEPAASPMTYFVPTDTRHLITVQMPFGASTVIIKSATEERRFFVSTTHYAVLFRTSAREITENAVIPINEVEESIRAPLAYRLALPVLADLSALIPTNMEIFTALAHKLIVKNKLYNAGSEQDVREVLSAMTATTPYLFKMENLSRFDAPVYRSEETLAGYEAHVWLPNSEIERWRALCLLLNNIPQLYKLKSVEQGEIYFDEAGKLRRHFFDFDSPLANSVLDNFGSTVECFLNLFKLTLTVESEHFLEFCAATYPFDNFIEAPGLETPDADPLAITNWQNFSLAGRFEQQFALSYRIHDWVYDTPLRGDIDGINRFFKLSETPATAASVKLFIDGLLQYQNIDYRLSLNANFRSGAFQVTTSNNPGFYAVTVGTPRQQLAPVFTSIEVEGGANLQLLTTIIEQDYHQLGILVSDPPSTTGVERISINYVTPDKAAEDYAGANQYGSEDLAVGTVFCNIVFPTPVSDISYQLFVQYAVEAAVSPAPSAVSQLIPFVRGRSLSSALVELSGAVEDADAKLYWWLIEGDGVALERGTITLSDGDESAAVNFSNGPYFDQVTVIAQLWTTNTFGNSDLLLSSFTNVGPAGTLCNFSQAIEGSDYRLDYAVFASEAGELLEIFNPPAPGQIVEAHYDTRWSWWAQGTLTPEADGLKREFTLPFKAKDLESIYLTLNGRLMTQGHEKQYTVSDDGLRIKFMFPPQPQQIGYAVYPLEDPATQELPSRWSQDYLSRRADYLNGAHASGLIRFIAPIEDGVNLTIDNVDFRSVETARGVISNSTTINIGDSITFVELNVQLTANTVPSSENEFANNISRDEDAKNLVAAINDHSVLGPLYFAEYLGSGISEVRAKSLSTTANNQTLATFGTTITAVNIEGDAAPSGDNVATFESEGRTFGLNASKYNSSTNQILIANNQLYNDVAVSFDGAVPSGITAGDIYYVIDAATSSFRIAVTMGGPAVALVDTGSGYSTMSVHEIEVENDLFFSKQHGFSVGEIVRVKKNEGVLPEGLEENKDYWIVDADTNWFKLSVVRDGPAHDIVDRGELSFFSIESLHVFASNVSLEADAKSLTQILSQNLSRFIATNSSEHNAAIIAISAKLVGASFNIPSISSSPEVEVRGLFGGVDLTRAPSFATPKIAYNYDAPIVALDGLSTRLFREYSGNEILFDYRPVTLQEPYFISQVFEIDHHPLDSTAANQPCSYPNGIFTQGFLTQLTSDELEIEYEASLVITINNLPVQEEPFGVKDGVNTIFTLSLTSCAAQDSIMLFVDGVYQPPSTYTYAVNGSQGQITLSTAPVPMQMLWIWYVPLGDACVDERTRALLGAVDDTNQTFTVPEAPWANSAALTLYLEGLFQLPGQDYLVPLGNTSVQFMGTKAPVVGQSLWAHYNLGSVIPVDRWRQLRLGVGDGSQTVWVIPTLLSVELPTSEDAVLIYLDGLNQRRGVDFDVEVDNFGAPNGTIRFLGGPPEVGRIVDVAYIRAG